jgi:hypothetical protein
MQIGKRYAFSIQLFTSSGKYTPDGRPVLYKHRDTGTPHNALVYFTDGKYSAGK